MPTITTALSAERNNTPAARILFTSLALIFSLAVTRTLAVADPAVHVAKPGRGISLDVGGAKVVGYFMPSADVCRVTLMIGARPDADGTVAPGAVRMEVPVSAGRTARVATPEGRGLELACGTGARIATIAVRDVTASVR